MKRPFVYLKILGGVFLFFAALGILNISPSVYATITLIDRSLHQCTSSGELCAGGDCWVSSALNPESVIYLDPPGSESSFATTFFNDIGGYNEWTLGFGEALNGVLTINSYEAITGNCYGGAHMDATYTPEDSDQSSLAWIQMYSDNVGDGRVHIDPWPNDDDQPFYWTDEEHELHGLNLIDWPRDPCPGSCDLHRWVRFETYLCSWDPDPPGHDLMTVTVHDGFYWGYDVTCTSVPEPATILLLLSAFPLIRFFKHRFR